MHLFNVPNVHSQAPWLSVEFFACGGAAVLIALASVLIVFSGEYKLFVAGVRKFIHSTIFFLWFG